MVGGGAHVVEQVVQALEVHRIEENEFRRLRRPQLLRARARARELPRFSCPRYPRPTASRGCAAPCRRRRARRRRRRPCGGSGRRGASAVGAEQVVFEVLEDVLRSPSSFVVARLRRERPADAPQLDERLEQRDRAHRRERRAAATRRGSGAPRPTAARTPRVRARRDDASSSALSRRAASRGRGGRRAPPAEAARRVRTARASPRAATPTARGSPVVKSPRRPMEEPGREQPHAPHAPCTLNAPTTSSTRSRLTPAAAPTQGHRRRARAQTAAG